MFQRIGEDNLAVEFPKDWAENFKQILLKIYGDKCIEEEKTFEVYGYSYPNEILIVISFVGLDKFETPISLFLSCDLLNSDKPDKITNNLFDSAGFFFDSYFNFQQNNPEEIWDDYIFEWEEVEFNKMKFFYKVTRENIALTLEAEELLKS